MNRIALLTISAAVIAVVGPAQAAPPKPMTQRFTYTDNTADPTASAVTGPRCDGMLAPNEPGLEFTAPAAGKLTVSLTATGDWGLEVLDAKGRLLGSSDGDTPEDQEKVTVKLKTAGTFTVLPCNLGGLPQASGVIEYKP